VGCFADYRSLQNFVPYRPFLHSTCGRFLHQYAPSPASVLHDGCLSVGGNASGKHHREFTLITVVQWSDGYPAIIAVGNIALSLSRGSLTEQIVYEGD